MRDVITKVQKGFANKKIEDFKKLSVPMKWKAIRGDPTLFAYAILKDPLDHTKPFRAYDWQSLFLSDKSKNKLLVKARQIGGSQAICVDILHKLTWADSDRTMLVFSKGEKQAQDIVYKLRLLMRNAKITYAPTLKVDSKSELYKKNKNGTECRVISEVATFSALGHSPSDIYVDEYSYFERDKDFYEHIILPMTAKTNAATTILSSPWSTMTHFYILYKNNPYFSKYHFDYKLCHPESWAKMMKNTVDIINYRSEVLAEFVSGEANQYYPAELVDECTGVVDKIISSDKVYYIGVDWGQMKSANVVTVISHQRIDEHTNDVQVVEVITRKRVPYTAIMGEIRILNDRYNPSQIFCDTGAGAAQVDMFNQELGINVEGVPFTLQSKIDMNSNLKKLMERKEIKLPNYKPLTDELKSFQYQISTLSKKMKLFGDPDDHVDSLALACMGVSNYRPVSLTIIPKKSIVDMTKNKIQQDLINNTLREQLVVCEKCMKECSSDPYFMLDKSEIKPDKKYLCPNHS